jgi:xanthine/uracil permease
MASITTTTAPAGAPPERHPVDEVLPPQLMVTYGLQHVLSMAAGVIAVPLILAGVLKLSPADTAYLVTSTLFICGLATLVQTLGVWKVGVKLPIVQGASLLPVATQWCAGGVGAKNFGAEKNIAFAAGTLLLILLIYRFLPGFSAVRRSSSG